MAVSLDFSEVASGLSRGGCEDVDSVMVQERKKEGGGDQGVDRYLTLTTNH